MVELGDDTSGGRAFLLRMVEQRSRARAFERRLRDIRLGHQLREQDAVIDLRDEVTPTVALPEPRPEH